MGRILVKSSVSRQEIASLSMPLGGWDLIGVRARFGSYRGLARLMLAQLESVAGRLRSYKQIRWERVKRVVFVCYGNICRSPYAEKRAVIYGLTVASFGLSADVGIPADPTACRVAARRGIELAPHRACDIKSFEFRDGDLLVAMEPRQARAISRRVPSASYQLTLLGIWCRPPRPHIHDPHRLSEAYWRQCFDTIDSAVEAIAEQMRLSRE